jgi:hypothetical protein
MKRKVIQILFLSLMISILYSCTSMPRMQDIGPINMNYVFINYYSFLLYNNESKHIKIYRVDLTTNTKQLIKELKFDNRNRIIKSELHNMDNKNSTIVEYTYKYPVIEKRIIGKTVDASKYIVVNNSRIEFVEGNNGKNSGYGTIEKDIKNNIRYTLNDWETKKSILVFDYNFSDGKWISYNELDANNTDDIWYEHINIYDGNKIRKIVSRSEKYDGNTVLFEYSKKMGITQIEYLNNDGVVELKEEIEYL